MALKKIDNAKEIDTSVIYYGKNELMELTGLSRTGLWHLLTKQDVIDAISYRGKRLLVHPDEAKKLKALVDSGVVGNKNTKHGSETR